MQHTQHGDHRDSAMHPYRKLAWMTALMFVAMYVLMYAMVDRFANAYSNLNQVYMSALMTGAMAAIELAIMRHMYPNRARNVLILALCALGLGIGWVGIRQQVGIGDRQFLRSMIPHHAGALLMCGEASISDPRIHALCRDIRASQQREIELMEELLENPKAPSQ